jgi:hypothetical protein
MMKIVLRYNAAIFFALDLFSDNPSQYGSVINISVYPPVTRTFCRKIPAHVFRWRSLEHHKKRM